MEETTKPLTRKKQDSSKQEVDVEEEVEVEEDKKEPRQPKKPFADESPEIVLSQLLYDLMLEHNPKAPKPALQTWAKSIKTIINRGHSQDDIDKVIRWCQQDDFWFSNIRSTAKLNKQFDTLLLQMNGKQPNQTPDPFGMGVQSQEHNTVFADKEEE